VRPAAHIDASISVIYFFLLTWHVGLKSITILCSVGQAINLVFIILNFVSYNKLVSLLNKFLPFQWIFREASKIGGGEEDENPRA
jgi:hypothetical protein